MLTNEKLGQAIAAAIRKKIDSGAIKYKADVARHFRIAGSSLNEWEKKGTVSKNKLGELINYFSDVVDENHWIDQNVSYSASAVRELSRTTNKPKNEGGWANFNQCLLDDTVEINSNSPLYLTSKARRVDVIYSTELVPGQFSAGKLIKNLNKTISVTPQEFSPTAFALIYTGSAMGEMLEHQQPIILDERQPKPGDLCMLRKNNGFMFCVFESESTFGMVFRLKGTQSKLTTPPDRTYTVYKVMALRNASDIE